jgi:uncharacterized protein (TIGR02646 family)
MIRVNRGPEPEGFMARSEDWQRRFREARLADAKLTPASFWQRVRRELVRDVNLLDAAFYSKCAFCESKIRHVSPAHLEHYRPKSGFSDLMFIWQNWLIACPRCNIKKGMHFPLCEDDQPCLLDPTTDDPSEHLDFLDAQILAKTYRGEQTISLVGLDCSPLDEERARWLIAIRSLLLLWLCEVPVVSIEARELLIWAMQPDAPYAAMTRAFLRRNTPLFADPHVPHPPVHPADPIKRIDKLIKECSDRLAQLT